MPMNPSIMDIDESGNLIDTGCSIEDYSSMTEEARKEFGDIELNSASNCYVRISKPA